MPTCLRGAVFETQCIQHLFQPCAYPANYAVQLFVFGSLFIYYFAEYKYTIWRILFGLKNANILSGKALLTAAYFYPLKFC